MRPTRTGLCVIAALLLFPAAARAQGVVEEPVVIDGQMTEEAALGQRLFEEGRFYEAAPVLRRVAVGDTGDAERDKQIAHYNLAVALYRLKLHHASVALFSEIADRPAHAMWGRALPWLSRLAVELPEPSGVIEPSGSTTGNPSRG